MSDVALEYLDRYRKTPPICRPRFARRSSGTFEQPAHGRQNAYDIAPIRNNIRRTPKNISTKYPQRSSRSPASASSILSLGRYASSELGHALSPRRAGDGPNRKRPAFFTEAREYFTQAGNRLLGRRKTLLRSLRTIAWQQRILLKHHRTQEMEVGVVQGRFKLGLVEYHLAQTYDDPKITRTHRVAQRRPRSALTIFTSSTASTRKTNAASSSISGTDKRLWNWATSKPRWMSSTKCLPRVRCEADAALAPIYTQATLFRYSTLRKQGKVDDLVAEGSKWSNRIKIGRISLLQTPAVLEIAKAYQAQAEKATGD